MKLEIDIDEDYYKIICKRVQDNKPFHSSYEYEIIASGKPKMNGTTKHHDFSKEFQNELLNLFEMCLENHTDGLTLTFIYPHAKLEVDMTFKGEKIKENNK